MNACSSATDGMPVGSGRLPEAAPVRLTRLG
jgi:hypothetical protein